MLTVQTRNNYRTQLRRLWEIYKLMLDTDNRKEALLRQITGIADKLGYELDRLDVILYSSQRGRPRVNPDVSDLEAELKSRKEDPTFWTPEAIEQRRVSKMKESEELLKEMMQQHGGDNEGPKSTADQSEGTGSDNPVVQK